MVLYPSRGTLPRLWLSRLVRPKPITPIRSIWFSEGQGHTGRSFLLHRIGAALPPPEQERSTSVALALRKPDTPDRRNRFWSDEATQPQPKQSPTRRIQYHRSTLLDFSHDRSGQAW